MSIKKLKKDVRGAALIYVVVVAAIVILLGAMTVTAAYVNLRSAKLQNEANNNFNNANKVVNIVVCGLQNDVAEAYHRACIKADTYTTEIEAKRNFKFIFTNELDLILNNGSDTDGLHYSAKHIQEYVQDVLPKDISYTITALNGENVIQKTEDGLVLRNIHITYESDIGYYDEVTVDLKITIPNFKFKSQIEKLQLGAIVADNGLRVSTDTFVNINGNIYLGQYELDGNAMLLDNNASLNIVTPMELIAGGIVKVGDNAQLSIVGNGNSLYGNYVWAEGFNFDSHVVANIGGRLHVIGDTITNGDDSHVQLLGKYFGVGYPQGSINGGGIVENGSNSTIGVDGLESLITTNVAYPNQTEIDALLGQLRNQYFGSDTLIGKKDEVSYGGLIDSSQLVSFISHVIAAKQYGDVSLTGHIQVVDDNAVILNDESGAMAVIVNNIGGDAYELNGGSGIVIVSGDVKLTGEWTGTIIAGGRVYCDNNGDGASVGVFEDDANIGSVLSLACTLKIGDSTKTVSVINLFSGYENVNIDDGADDKAEDVNDFANCVTVVGWINY